MSPLFHSPTQAWEPVDHTWSELTVMLRRFRVVGVDRAVDEGVGFIGTGKMSSAGTFSPKVRLTLLIFLRFASASFFWRKKASEVGVIGLMGKSSMPKVEGERSGLSWGFLTRWSFGGTTTGLR